MKRRSFLAMLGLAPVAGGATAAPQETEINWRAIQSTQIDNLLEKHPDGIPADLITGVWCHPDYEALHTPDDTRIIIVKVPRTPTHCGAELQQINKDGVVLIRQWARR